MNVTVHGKQLAVGDALKVHVSERLEDINTKFFNRAIDGTVTFSREGHGFFHAHIAIHVGKDIMVQSSATEDDPYLSFDVASGKIARQLRRYKNRLRDHKEHMERSEKLDRLARDIILAPATEQNNEAEEATHPEPVVVAEMTMPIQSMTVADAVMRMDLSGHPAMMFKNASNGQLNMVYRRPDGNIGWVDPNEE